MTNTVPIQIIEILKIIEMIQETDEIILHTGQVIIIDHQIEIDTSLQIGEIILITKTIEINGTIQGIETKGTIILEIGINMIGEIDHPPLIVEILIITILQIGHPDMILIKRMIDLVLILSPEMIIEIDKILVITQEIIPVITQTVQNTLDSNQVLIAVMIMLHGLLKIVQNVCQNRIMSSNVHLTFK